MVIDSVVLLEKKDSLGTPGMPSAPLVREVQFIAIFKIAICIARVITPRASGSNFTDNHANTAEISKAQTSPTKNARAKLPVDLRVITIPYEDMIATPIGPKWKIFPFPKITL